MSNLRDELNAIEIKLRRHQADLKNLNLDLNIHVGRINAFRKRLYNLQDDIELYLREQEARIQNEEDINKS